jgi:hypothetical protein
MFHLSENELAAIDRNHTRLAKIGDRGHTANLFAALDAEAAHAEAQAAQTRRDAQNAEQARLHALRAEGADLPLFADYAAPQFRGLEPFIVPTFGCQSPDFPNSADYKKAMLSLP